MALLDVPVGSKDNLPEQLPVWRTQAACIGKTELFFAEDPDSEAEAKRICVGCPVRQECADFADANREEAGVWAGERRGMPHLLDERTCIDCGAKFVPRGHKSRRCDRCRVAPKRTEVRTRASGRRRVERRVVLAHGDTLQAAAASVGLNGDTKLRHLRRPPGVNVKDILGRLNGERWVAAVQVSYGAENDYKRERGMLGQRVKVWAFSVPTT